MLRLVTLSLASVLTVVCLGQTFYYEYIGSIEEAQLSFMKCALFYIVAMRTCEEKT